MNITQEQLTTLTASLLPYITGLEFVGSRNENGNLDTTQDFRLVLTENDDACFYILVSHDPNIIQCITFMGVIIYKGFWIEECFKEIKEMLIRETEKIKKDMNLVN